MADAEPSVANTHVLGVKKRAHVEEPKEYGNGASFWVEYPSGLVDLTRSTPLVPGGKNRSAPPLTDGQLDVAVDGDREIRIDAQKSALVVIDMQNFFLHPALRDHPRGLACVDPLLSIIPPLRAAGVQIVWVNWGLTDHELDTIPPSLVRSFTQNGGGGFGSDLPDAFGRLLMRGALNTELYGALQTEYAKGKEQGTDVWIHKNRMSGLWGAQSALDLYLQEAGIETLFFSGVNTDQCVLGTVVDSYYRGYDVVLVKDTTATTSPQGGYENVCYNVENSYGFVTDSRRLAQGALRKEYMASLTIIVATTLANGIGQSSHLPWHLPQEMAYFARVTTSAPEGSANAVIMGRNTWEGIPPKFRPLKERINVIVSSNADYLKGSHYAEAPPSVHTSLRDAVLHVAGPKKSVALPTVHRCFIIGGASIYKAALDLMAPSDTVPVVDRILLTRILSPAFEDCDVFFPRFLDKKGNDGAPLWTQASHDELEAWVGSEVPKDIQREENVEYEFQMWTRCNCQKK